VETQIKETAAILKRFAAGNLHLAIISSSYDDFFLNAFYVCE
jgi:hypothetical protein